MTNSEAKFSMARLFALVAILAVPGAVAWVTAGPEWAVQIATFAGVLQLLMRGDA